jgi:hypothetical protein
MHIDYPYLRLSFQEQELPKGANLFPLQIPTLYNALFRFPCNGLRQNLGN